MLLSDPEHAVIEAYDVWMLISQVFMMKNSSTLETEERKTFRNTEEWPDIEIFFK